MDGSRGAAPAAGVRPALVIAVAGSAMAGLVHAAAVRSHEGDSVLALLFVLCSMAQLLWALAAAVRPIPPVLVTGLVINAGALIVWLLTRTVGIGFVDALAGPEEVASQDLTAALFAAASVAATSRLLLRPNLARRPSLRWAGAITAIALLGALPALSAEHTHVHADGGEHEHEHAHGETAAGDDHAHEHTDGTTDGHAHADGEAHEHGAVDGGDHAHDGAATGHDHGSGEAALAGHEHGGTTGDGHDHSSGDPSHPHDPGVPHDPSHPHDPGVPHDPGDPHEHPDDPGDPHEHPDDPGDPHEHPDDPGDPHEHPDPDPEDPITSIDDPRLTEEQWNAAIQLIVGVTGPMRSFVTEEDVLAAGYESVHDGSAPGEYEHFYRWDYLTDEYELDPTHIEAITMKVNADGSKRVVAAMYVLTVGKTLDDAPPLAGELSTWHDHDELCFDGPTFVGLADGGTCVIGVLFDMPPMLHVWVEANPCGPFAVIDENGQDCGATHEH